MTKNSFLENCPVIRSLIEHIDRYLEKEFPEFFGSKARHPFLPLKKHKIIHDNLWGTNRYSWQELIIIDSPIFQRLRDIHQTGLAFHIYVCAHHTRFEHSLGVVTIASRIFERIMERDLDKMKAIAKAVFPNADTTNSFDRLKQKLRIAALLHDTGHSLFSHSSERVYGRLSLLKSAAEELSDLTGKEKHPGEVLSFCIALTASIRELITRAGNSLLSNSGSTKASPGISFENVALIIVGRSSHPFLQFMGDIVSSGFDADKLDYLVRDAVNAGLPLQYDFERYLFSVKLEKDILGDGENRLKNLYESLGATNAVQSPAKGDIKYPYYETYRLRLPKKAMNTVEQIIICKFMLFNYIYHHGKVRAAEGILERLLEKIVAMWRDKGLPDKEIVTKFLDITDSSLRGDLRREASEAGAKEYLIRLVNRLLPREVYAISGGSITHAERPRLVTFLTDLQDREKRRQWIERLEKAIAEELSKIDDRTGDDTEAILQRAGIWVDVPKPPEFEDVDELVVGKGSNGIAFTNIFPIGEWTEAYTHYKYQVRIFAYSEYVEKASKAAWKAMERVLEIGDKDFYKNIKRDRTFEG